MILSDKIWIKIQEGFNLKRIKDKISKNMKKKTLPDYQIDLNINK